MKDENAEALQGREARIASLSVLPDRLFIADRLELSKIVAADAPRFSEIIARNPDIKECVAWASRVCDSEDVLPNLQRYSNGNVDGRFAIIGAGKVVGYVGIHPGEQAEEYGIGYFLDEAARGHGYVVRAVAAVIEQANVCLAARYFYLQIVPGNDASTTVAHRLGFQLTETVMGADFPVEQQRWRLTVGEV